MRPGSRLETVDFGWLDMENLGFVARNVEDEPMLKHLVRNRGLVDLSDLHGVAMSIVREHYSADAAQKSGLEPR